MMNAQFLAIVNIIVYAGAIDANNKLWFLSIATDVKLVRINLSEKLAALF
ncbi:MAG: NADH-quinone oxidoreductase subunit J, partial [Betaproteobacteria bacterium]|nr:NADH-quinone oxidoreductase subunit J [Betaproteobacteria bacterium]